MTKSIFIDRNAHGIPDNISRFYGDIRNRKDLAFRETPRSDINELTHCYHSYPAKFIPQLARYLISEFSAESDLIWDPFCGSGTLNVEALRSSRNSLGSDVNPVSILISKAKTTPLSVDSLSDYKSRLFEQLETSNIRDTNYYLNRGVLNGNFNELKNWFPNSNLRELAHILSTITDQHDYPTAYRNFSLCCLSSILKKTSFCLDASIKFQKDPDKKPESPIVCFERQFNRMEKANKSFCAETSNLDVSAILLRQNAKHILPRQHRDKVDHIITSPPYLISYEYSDLFRLSIYLFYYQNNYTKFKTSFIGTKLIKSVTGPRNGHVPRPRFLGIDDRDIYGWKKSIVNYYAEMASFILNARKHLKRKGKFILIVGDTTMRSIYIPNAYILSEIARHSGFRLKEKLKREIIGKYLPRYRDKATGKFTGRTDPNNKEVHKEEFILIFERQ